MARVLTCIDAQPLPDGSCQAQAWIEQPSVADMLPPLAVADQWGKAFFFGIVLLGAIVSIIKPIRGVTE